MLRLPARFAALILCFAPLFRQHTWRHAEVLLIGAILVPGQRTVTSILRISGLCRERRFVIHPAVMLLSQAATVPGFPLSHAAPARAATGAPRPLHRPA